MIIKALSRFRVLLLFSFIVLNVSSSYAREENRCSKLFDIHLGYNAFINIVDYSLGYKPNLRKARTIYDNFPNGNESLRQAGLFMINNAQTENHPPVDTLLSNISKANGLFLSELSFCSKIVGEIEYRKCYKKLANVPEYEEFYYRTFIWGYPIGWDRITINNYFDGGASNFIKKYDTYLQSAKPLTESEKMLYSLFKLQIEFETNKNETAFLAGLDELISANPTYFSILNYQQYIKEYFPSHGIPTKLTALKKDSFDRDDEHPIYATIKKNHNSFQEAINELAINPFDDFLENYVNVRKLLPKTSFSEVLKNLNQIDTLVTATKQKCYVSAIGQNLTNHIILSNDPRFSKSQIQTLKAELFKKWVNSHIACKITYAFYMDESLIKEWNALSKSNQEMLNNHFIKVLEASDNHKYLLQLQKVLRVKP